jgi:hypothetical protein
MADYTQSIDFSAKDALDSGQALKVAKGADIDTELGLISTAIESKVDESREAQASGIATLDGSTKIPVAQLPAATTSAVGVLEIATDGEATTGTATDKWITPANLQAVLDQNGALAEKITTLSDPGADRILFWDDSATGSELAYLTVGTGLDLTTTNLTLSHLGIESLSDPGSDKVLFWDETANATAWLTFNEGIEFSGETTVGLSDVSAGVAQPVVITSGTFTFDLSSISEITGPLVDQANDGFLINDAGTLKVMPYDQTSILLESQDAVINPFDITHANTIQVLTGTTNRVWTIPTNATTAFEIGTIIICQNSGTGDLTITASSGVVLDSVYHAAAADAQSDRVRDGGTAVLIKTATNTWALSGDIADS